MSGIVGVELGRDAARAVRLAPFGRRVSQSASVPFDPARPQDAVIALRSALGPATGISIAVGFDFCEVKRVHLPPASTVERERMLALEPERYFAAADQPLATGFDESSQTAFAVPAGHLDAWTAAFEQWAPVLRVEASPVAAARLLSDGSFVVAAADGGHGVMDVLGGALHGVRRLPAGASFNGARPFPARGGVSAELTPALASALGAHGSLTGLLAPASVAHRIVQRRRIGTGWRAAAALGGIVFAAWALSHWRERQLTALEREAARLTGQATVALSASQEIAALRQEAATLAAVAAERPDPLRVLATLGSLLPEDAVVLNVRMQGDEWQVDGTANDASALVPLLDRSRRFAAVHPLSATSRFRDGARMRETFSIAFRAPRPAP